MPEGAPSPAIAAPQTSPAGGSSDGRIPVANAQPAPFTITVNAVYDALLPELGDSAWKILSYLTRHIDGEPRHRGSRSAVFPVSAIVEGTGKSRNTVLADLALLATAGAIVWEHVPRRGNSPSAVRVGLRTPRHTPPTTTVPEGRKL